MQAVAVNVGANTSLPGFRGPLYPDGSFVYVPIPEREPVAERVPTYADLDLPVDVPAEHRDRQVHLDPLFAGYAGGESYTYGDDYGVKARPLAALSAGDHVFFYATLSTARSSPVVDSSDPPADWQAPEWGAYVIGQFELGVDPVTGDAYRDLPADERARYAENAHVKRDPFDAEVLLWGDPEGSALYDRAVPLSTAEAGADANPLVTDLSADSGKGPWWRRPLRFDDEGVAALLECHETGDYDEWV
jgi:hypothetical protein